MSNISIWNINYFSSFVFISISSRDDSRGVGREERGEKQIIQQENERIPFFDFRSVLRLFNHMSCKDIPYKYIHVYAKSDGYGQNVIVSDFKIFEEKNKQKAILCFIQSG